MNNEHRSNKTHGIFIKNIIHFPERTLNIMVKQALYQLINVTCENFGTYGLFVSQERPHINTTTAFLRFDDDEYNPLAAELINDQPLMIAASPYRLQLIAYLNPVRPSQQAEDFHQQHRLIRMAGCQADDELYGQHRRQADDKLQGQHRRQADDELHDYHNVFLFTRVDVCDDKHKSSVEILISETTKTHEP